MWVSIHVVAAACLFLAGRGELQPETTVRSVRVDAANPSAPVVVIEGGGPLPAPQVGVLDTPPRVYLDFPGVRPDTTGTTPQSSGVVRRVRVGVFKTDPVITRVVIDLVERTPHRLDATERDRGRVRVTLGPTQANLPAPVRPAEMPKAARPATSTAGPDRTVALGALEQLERFRALLSAIDARSDIPEPALTSAIGEFENIKQMLTSRPPDKAEEILVKICVLGANAASTRIGAQQDNDPGRAWNAASAAAGALIMLDRAASELRAPASRK